MHSQRRSVVANAFGILKDTFHGGKHIFISIIPNLIICFVILHNLLFSCDEINVEHILHLLQEKKNTQEEHVAM
jgi:hypothetical protein